MLCTLPWADVRGDRRLGSRDLGWRRGLARFVRALILPTTALSSRSHPSRMDPDPLPNRPARRGEPQSEARDFGMPSELPVIVDKQPARRRGSICWLPKLP